MACLAALKTIPAFPIGEPKQLFSAVYRARNSIGHYESTDERCLSEKLDKLVASNII